MDRRLPPDIHPIDEYREISLFNLMILLDNVWRGAKDSQVGFEDAYHSLPDLTMALEKQVPIKLTEIESALWSCNLLQETGKFWHPKRLSFDNFVKRLLKDEEVFNKVYNAVEGKK